MEGKISFFAQPTPNWDRFTTVTISATISQRGGGGSARIEQATSLAEAERFAKQILDAIEIVRND